MITGASSGPSTSTASRLPLILIISASPSARATSAAVSGPVNGRSLSLWSERDGAGVEVPRVAGQRTGTVGGDQHAVADPVASVARHVDPRLVGDDHARLQQGRVAVLQPRRLVHAEPDPVSLSVPQVLPEAGVAD